MMRIGVRAHDFGTLPAEELAARIAAKGVACVQLAVNKAIAGMNLKAGDLNPGLACGIGEAFRSRGIQIAVLGCYVNPIHPDPETRKSLLSFFKDHLCFARDFGCGLVGLETGSLNADYSFNPDNSGSKAFGMFVDSIGSLVEEAEKFGAIVGIEGVTTHVISTPARMREALDAVGSRNLQVIFDPVNLLSLENHRNQDRVIDEAFECFGDRIVVVHAKDFIAGAGRLDTVPAGRGLFNYPHLFKLLLKRKPGINVLLENAGEDSVDECVRHLNAAARQP
jgi:L-ribulose-5-phosphate 3-epimerase